MKAKPFNMMRRRTRQRGSAYVLVLAVTMLVMVIGMAVAVQTRIQVRQASQITAAGNAQTLAASGMEYALFKIDQAVQTEIGGGAPWRNQFTDSLVVGPINFGSGSFTYMLEDATGDGNLADDATEPVYVEVAATAGLNIHRVRVRMVPGPDPNAPPIPLDSLGYALVSEDKIEFDNADVHADVAIASNNKITGVSGATINAPLEAFGKITGGTFNGTVSQYLSPKKQMPNASVFDYYIQNGTSISYASLPDYGLGPEMWGVLLSPSSNPYGLATNPLGIYIIDCGGLPILIEECRIVGTLVLLNAGPGSKVFGPITWEPAVANYPSLLVQGDMLFQVSEQRLDEASTVWSSSQLLWTLLLPNFNLPGTPYQGQTDIDRIDTYPSAIAGLVYVSGELTVDQDSTGDTTTFEGVVLAGDATLVDSGSTLNLFYSDAFFNDPPPGFTAPPATSGSTGPMQIVEGSWEQIVD